MATPLSILCMAPKRFAVMLKSHAFLTSKRYLLSSAYSCTDAWNKSLKDQSLSEIPLSELAVQIKEKLEKVGSPSAVDLNILAHQFDGLSGDIDEAEFMEDIFARFNTCQASFPHNDSTSHAIVRGYIRAGLGNRLPDLLSSRLTYGIFPNSYTLNLILDHFLNQKDFSEAAKIAYCSTLQEDFSSPVNYLLCLQACVQHLMSSSIDELAPPPKEDSDGEEDWIPVKYIKYPFYDDHFDIKDERFLLGKSLMYLGHWSLPTCPEIVISSLKVIGSGLYHRFNEGLSTLESIAGSDCAISQEALDVFSESLDKVESRDVDEPEVEIALRTVDNEIHKLLPTHVEKEGFVVNFNKVKEDLISKGKVVTDFSLKEAVHSYVGEEIRKHEEKEIASQLSLFEKWTDERKQDLENEMKEMRKAERIQEMKKQILEIKEEEELLSYFDMEEKIRLHFVEEDKETDAGLTIAK